MRAGEQDTLHSHRFFASCHPDGMTVSLYCNCMSGTKKTRIPTIVVARADFYKRMVGAPRGNGWWGMVMMDSVRKK